MKNNIEAKFYNDVLNASKIENSNIEKVSFIIDDEIDNPSNTDVVDCTKFYKEVTRSKKSKKIPELYTESKTKNSSIKTANERYNLTNFVV